MEFARAGGTSATFDFYVHSKVRQLGLMDVCGRPNAGPAPYRLTTHEHGHTLEGCPVQTWGAALRVTLSVQGSELKVNP